MKYIRALILLIAIMAISSIIWLGFTGEHESLFRLCISIAVFASLYFVYNEEKTKKQKKITLLFWGLSVISITAGLVQFFH
ncbi:hypothetical protein [Pseudalkalibacillus hwajinpoensis]|uniref:hypothetical protein n=1 Tax=Guptibacillus hwajinpoensis TaxID=208199 RepID=UPI001CFD1936|nr:hypothetical protein [Pseudalkalibacillus hwajinpoensis]